MKMLFWISSVFILYTYLGYPFLLFLAARFLSRPVLLRACTPAVSVVIAACNEERNIAKRIEDLLVQDYGSERYEVVVVSDGSTDRTNEIVASYASSKVLLVQLAERVGKAEALNLGVARASGDVVVFADARQTFASDVLRRLAANFADPSVGCVSGELVLLDDVESGIGAEMGAYWRYEKMIRKFESASGSVVGATGAIYAIRKGLYRPLPSGTILDDVLTPMTIALQGYRVVFDGAATAYDVVSKDIAQEWTRKVRTLAGNWQLLSIAPSLIAPWRCPLWWRFLSHKIFRLLVPFVLPLLLAASVLSEGMVCQAALFAQLALYITSLAGFVIPGKRKLRFVKVANFFLVMNLAAVVGFWRWISGKCTTTWQPAYMK